jgi:hypothetical protein
LPFLFNAVEAHKKMKPFLETGLPYYIPDTHTGASWRPLNNQRSCASPHSGDGADSQHD